LKAVYLHAIHHYIFPNFEFSGHDNIIDGTLRLGNRFGFVRVYFTIVCRCFCHFDVTCVHYFAQFANYSYIDLAPYCMSFFTVVFTLDGSGCIKYRLPPVDVNVFLITKHQLHDFTPKLQHEIHFTNFI
jgi:hypothetical protein